jgi:uncharacterized damage-inducible protein DinB
MTHAHVEQLAGQIELATKRLRERLAGITDDEYLWEPVAKCWTVRRRDTATSPMPMGGGEWVFDNAEELYSPGPFTTIAWRLMHLTDVFASYQIALWGGKLSDDLVEATPSAAEGAALWERHANTFTWALTQEDDETLQRSIQVPWWPDAAPRWQVVSNVATEVVHHGAEIGVLRDLYARRGEIDGEQRK